MQMIKRATPISKTLVSGEPSVLSEFERGRLEGVEALCETEENAAIVQMICDGTLRPVVGYRGVSLAQHFGGHYSMSSNDARVAVIGWDIVDENCKRASLMLARENPRDCFRAYRSMRGPAKGICELLDDAERLRIAAEQASP